MPPKAKLHNNKGKLKQIPKTTTQTRTPVASTSAENVDPEQVAKQFEVELCWCIQQLQSSIESNKLNPKQTQDTLKTLNVLKSNKQPLIRKRQLMSVTFGDYRSKMAEEEKKLAKVNQQIKFSDGPPSKKSMFVKKSSVLSLGSSFKFNFPVENIEKLNLEEESKQENTTMEKSLPCNFKFQPSENAFKFNFNIEDN